MPEPRLRVDPEDRLRPAERRPQRPMPRKPRRRGPLRRAMALGLLLFLWGLIIGGGALAYFAFTLPDTSQLTVAEPRPSATILAADGSLLANLGDLVGQPPLLEQMTPI